MVDHRGMVMAAGNFYKSLHVLGANDTTQVLVSKGERDIFLIRFLDLCKDVTVDAGADTAICPGQSIYLSALASYAYTRWLPDGLPNEGLDVEQPGNYKLLVTDQHGCIASDSLVITMRTLPTVVAGRDTTLAAGVDLHLLGAAAQHANTLVWGTSGSGYFDQPDSLISTYSPSYSDISNGSVHLTLTATNTCADASSSLFLSIHQDDDGITAYPNPTQGLITLVCRQGLSITAASISTQSGYLVMPETAINNTMMQYDLSPYPPGTFLFHLTTGNGMVTKTINKL